MKFFPIFKCVKYSTYCSVNICRTMTPCPAIMVFKTVLLLDISHIWNTFLLH